MSAGALEQFVPAWSDQAPGEGKQVGVGQFAVRLVRRRDPQGDVRIAEQGVLNDCSVSVLTRMRICGCRA